MIAPRCFFDTSVLAPVYLSIHVHHGPSLALYSELSSGAGYLSLHSLAELYNTLTKPATPGRMSPVHALDCLNDVKMRLSLVNLDGAEYLQAALGLASLNLGGPLIYDALLLQAARRVNAETIYTWNVRHFQRLAPDLASRIRTP